MQAHHVFRALGECGNRVHVQRGGVGGQDGTGLHHAVQLLEHGFFHADFFKHGFDHHVGAAEVVVAECGAQQGHTLLVFVLFEFAFLDLGFVVLADGGQATVQRFLLHLQHLDGDASVQEVHGDTATHGARTDDCY